MVTKAGHGIELEPIAFSAPELGRLLRWLKSSSFAKLSFSFRIYEGTLVLISADFFFNSILFVILDGVFLDPLAHCLTASLSVDVEGGLEDVLSH